MDDIELKPCPHCGGEAELTFTNDNNRMPFVRCKYGSMLNPPCYSCQYPWNHKTVKDAVEAWNRRDEK